MPEIIRLARNVVGKVWPRVTARTKQGWQWVRRNPRTALWVAGVTVGAILLVLLIADWKPYSKHYQAFAPILALAAGLAIAGVTLMRHFAQTDADRQRRRGARLAICKIRSARRRLGLFRGLLAQACR